MFAQVTKEIIDTTADFVLGQIKHLIAQYKTFFFSIPAFSLRIFKAEHHTT